MQDAVNLGWKLAQVVRGRSPESLLDSYHAERHPAGARALQHSMAQSVLQRQDPRTAALTGTIDGLMVLDQPRRQVAALIHGLDIAYDLGPGHPLLGRRMPDLDLHAPGGRTTVFTLLHDARPVLLDLAGTARLGAGPWAGRVRLVEARFEGELELPVVGRVPAPAAVLIRPDGHVAWVGTGTDQGLAEALGTWFGPAGPAGSDRRAAT
jgi:hypothetical protein